MAGRRKRNRQRWRLLVKALIDKGINFNTGGSTVGIKDHERLPHHYQGQAEHRTGSEFWDKRASAGAIATAAPSMTWEIPKEEKVPVANACEKCHRCSECGVIHEEAAVVNNVLISPMVAGRIRAMMEFFSKDNKNEREWLGYLVADEQGVFVDMFIPKQVGYTGAVVVDKDAIQGNPKIDGVIHSHHSMNAFHSGTDDDNLVNNHPISIVVNMKRSDLDFHAVRTTTLPCGARFTARNVPVRMYVPDADDWLNESAAMVAEGASGYTKAGPTPVVVHPYGDHEYMG